MSRIVHSLYRILGLLLIVGVLNFMFGQEGAELLIITHDDFTQAIQNLTEWKYMKGMQTKVKKLSEIGSNPTNEQIRDSIIEWYNSWDPRPEYVLLVGDIGFLPVGQTSPCRSDNYYANMVGDFKAELSIGRFPCQTSRECSTMVNKTLAYEQTPYLEDTLWFKKSTIVIRFDNEGDTLGYYVGDLRYIRDTCMIPAGFVVDSLFNRAGLGWHNQGPDSARHVINVLNEGRGFLVYRGESSGDWYEPFRGIPDSARLSNGSKLPIILAGACRSVLFSTTVGEKWLRVGDPNILKGAVGYIGNTQYAALADWRARLNRAFFKAICLEDSLILGHAFLRAKDSLYTIYPTEEAFYAECNLLGDPTLQLWTEVPHSMVVGHQDAIEKDVPINLVVSVKDSASLDPIQGALVTLYKSGGISPEVFQSEFTNSEGKAVFENLTVPSSGILRVTATLDNYVPYQGEIEVYEIITDNLLALAYNGNRHLVRKPNSEELHLAYTNDSKIVYRYSTNGGTDWSVPTSIGEGKLPTISLSTDESLPSVAWTDDAGGLWYRRQTDNDQWSQTYHLWNPTNPDDMRLNSPPSIAIHASNPNTVHILVTRSGGSANRARHTVEDFTFTITQPGNGSFVLIEQISGPLEPPLRLFPSIVRGEVNNSLHAVWQRVDTICYATKPRNDPWVNWGWQFGLHGLQSGHPFVETYGDSIFVVWQRMADEEVYRGARYLQDTTFYSTAFSQTSVFSSNYPVNAWGLFTVYAEEPTMSSPYDIYYKIRAYDDRINVSGTEYSSLYPQSVAKFALFNYLYTAWLESDGEPPYEIRFKKIRHVEQPDMAFMTSSNGQSLSSPYLVARDSFVDDWQIPVDIGNSATTYQFALDPNYAYRAKAIAYHEASGQWCGRIMIDESLQFIVNYNTNVPETLECWIPPALYEDSVLTVSFNRIAGDFAAIGPIYIYRYEYDGGGGGPMSRQSQPSDHAMITVFPNPFKTKLNIVLQTPGQSRIGLKLYDVTGRLIKQFSPLSSESCNQITWDGIDNRGKAVPQGIYFLHIDNLDSGDILCRKVLRVD